MIAITDKELSCLPLNTLANMFHHFYYLWRISYFDPTFPELYDWNDAVAGGTGALAVYSAVRKNLDMFQLFQECYHTIDTGNAETHAHEIARWFIEQNVYSGELIENTVSS